MSGLQEALGEARDRGIITSEQTGRLTAFLAERGLIDTGFMAGPPDAPAAVTVAEASESPRFVRGFHDILITIGVIAALTGLWWLAPLAPVEGKAVELGALLVLPAVIVLAELLVRRQRLALPAFVLTAFYAYSVVTVLAFAIDEATGTQGSSSAAIVFFLSPLLLLPFYLRYRVPVALATMIVMTAFFVLLLVYSVLGLDDLGSDSPYARVPFALGLVCALALFAAAMAFDMSDPERLTRRSDVAFWLHLAAAPALLFATFGLILGPGKASLLAAEPGVEEASLALVLVAAMMLVGIVIDRRAFVTAGLTSLGVALGVLVTNSGLGVQGVSAFALLGVGVIVLLLGVGWQNLRRLIVAILPAGLKKRLRPA